MHGFVFAGLDKSWASSSKTSTDSTKASARPNPGGGFVANENFKRIYCMGRGEGRFDVAPTWVFILFFLQQVLLCVCWMWWYHSCKSTGICEKPKASMVKNKHGLCTFVVQQVGMRLGYE